MFFTFVIHKSKEHWKNWCNEHSLARYTNCTQQENWNIYNGQVQYSTCLYMFVLYVYNNVTSHRIMTVCSVISCH